MMMKTKRPIAEVFLTVKQIVVAAKGTLIRIHHELGVRG